MNTRTEIEISEEMNRLNSELVLLQTQGAPGWETQLRVIEIEVRLREVTEELSRRLAGYELPGKK